MNLTGDTNTLAMPMTDAEVNHLRRLLAWMRVEWMLDEDMQRGYMLGNAAAVAHGLQTPEQAGAHLVEKAKAINKAVPLYVRQAVKMLTKALRDHERKAGIVEAPAGEYTGVRRACLVTGCRARPGCPAYGEHCKSHIAHANSTRALATEEPT